MDTHYTSQLLISILFFAPGLVLLVGVAFVAMAGLLEKFLVPAQPALVTAHLHGDVAQSGNPAPGRIVASLKETMQEDDQRSRKVAR